MVATCPTVNDESVPVIEASPERMEYTKQREQIRNHVQSLHNQAVAKYVQAEREYLNKCPDNKKDTSECLDLDKTIKQQLSDITAIRSEMKSDNMQVRKSAERVMDEYGDADNTNGQQTLYRRAKDISQLGDELTDRNHDFIAAQQLMTQMQQKYRHAKKVLWIYVGILLALVGGFVFLYMMAYKQFAATGAPLGSASTALVVSAAEAAKKKANEISESYADDEDEEGDEEEMPALSEDEGEEGEEGEEEEE